MARAAANGKAAPAPAQRRPGVREQAVIASRSNLLRAATRIFAKHGFAGGRVGQISKAAKSYDRMIYYYFGSKEGLYIAVIEDMYRRMDEAEAKLDLDASQPVESLKEVIRFVWRYYCKNPEFVTLLNNENLHQGKHISKLATARQYSSQAISLVQGLIEAGAAQGVFSTDVAARDVYLMIAAMGYFYQSNRFTLTSFLGENLETPEALAHWESFMIDAVLRAVAPGKPIVNGAG